MQNENDGVESLGCFLDLILIVLTYAVDCKINPNAVRINFTIYHASIFLVGLYFMLEWGWVIAPVFHVGKLSYWSATGVFLVVRYLTSHSSSASDLKKNRSTRFSELGLDFAADTMALFVIWLVSLGI